MTAFMVCAVATLAQSVRWEPPGGQLGLNQVVELALVFDGCEPDGEVRLPAVDGVVFGNPSTSSQTSIINFKVSRTFSLVYPARVSKNAPVRIPSFTVQTDKGELRVPAVSYTVGNNPVGGTSLAVSDVAQAKLTSPKNTYWAGEVIPLTYNLTATYRYFHSFASTVNWPNPPVVAEEWSKPDPREGTLAGERKVVSSQTTRAIAKQPGPLTLPAASQMVNLLVGQTGFGLFSQPVVEQRQIETEPLNLTIKPLPVPPADFSGAIGEFALVSKVVPTKAAINEPVTWTLELTGTGNWPDITGLPSREVSNDFQVVQPKSKRDMKDASLFEGVLSEDVVLVPTQPGKYTLGPVRFTYFDTKSGAYKTISTTPVTVEITGGATAPVAQPTGPVQFNLPQTGATTPPATQPNLPPAVAPTPPDKLPRDPLPGPARGFAPLHLQPLVIAGLLISVLCPLLVWLVLAALRSKQTDPQRHRRAAHAALASLLAELRSTGSNLQSTISHLRSWQSHTSTLWGLRHAAPVPTTVQTQIARTNADAAAAWARLWDESDRALHGKDAALPSDWIMRAEGALRAVRVPGWNPFSLLALRNLLPVVLVLFALSVPSLAFADAASDAYRKGEFSTAETLLRKELATNPTDASVRGNLGLALAQQDRWADALAHWTSAALLDARSDANRWHLALGLQRSGLAPAELVALARGDEFFALARLATPAEWQFALLAAAVLLAAALCLLALGAYGRIGAWGRSAAFTSCLVAVLLAAAATLGLQTYGNLAHPDAVFVAKQTVLRSIPTEADTAQKTSPLSPGSIAVVDRTFLGWSRLVFPGGETGWARTEDLVNLYRP